MFMHFDDAWVVVHLFSVCLQFNMAVSRAASLSALKFPQAIYFDIFSFPLGCGIESILFLSFMSEH